MSELIFDFSKDDFFISQPEYVLGNVSRSLEELCVDGLLASPIASLQDVGYDRNRAVDPDETLLHFTSGLFDRLLVKSPSPGALVVHHSYAANTTEGCAPSSRELLARANYFPASLLRHRQLDHIPYWGSYSSGCTGFMSLLAHASSLLRATGVTDVVCLTTDLKPEGATFDSVKERLLTSDAASGFIATREAASYRVLGVAQYSSSRSLIPLVEVVKRAVEMTRQLCQRAAVNAGSEEMLFHYPNMFLEAWKMVSHFQKVPAERHCVDGMKERAHCLSSDATISLSRLGERRAGRVHVVYSFGSGLHLAVALLREV